MAKNRKSKPARNTSTTKKRALGEEEIRAFVGYNSDYYLKAWNLGPQRGSGSGFSIAGFFLSGLWLGYRKMYAKALVVGCVGQAYYLLVLLMGATMPLTEAEKLAPFLFILQLGLGIAIMLITGILGNRWYYSHTRQKILEVRSSTPSDREVRPNKLADTGRTSLLGAFTVCVPGILASPLTCVIPLLGAGVH